MKKRESKSPSRSTKRALTSSVLALVLCFVMLLGTTFAWFTDTASTGVNTIQAGTLDVALLMKDGESWVSAEGRTLDFIKASASEDKTILWEPGATYELPAVKIVNEGNLALDYQVLVSNAEGDMDLAKVLDVVMAVPVTGDNGNATTQSKPIGTLYEVMQQAKTSNTDPDGYIHGHLCAGTESEEITISLKMQTTADNYYQGMSLSNIAITVIAKQATEEYDSYNNQYDKDAKYPEVWDGATAAEPQQDSKGVYHITSAAELVGFAQAVNSYNSYSGKTVVLDTDIDLNGYAWTPIGKVTQTQNNPYFQGTFDGQGHTIYNLYVDKTNTADELGYTTAGLFGWIDASGATIKNVNISGATVKGNHYTGALVGYLSGTVENCSVTNSTVVSVHHDDNNDGDKAGGLVGYMNSNATVTNSSVSNSTVTAKRDAGGLVGCTYDNSCTVTGNSVSNTTVNYETQNGGEVVGRPQGCDTTDNTYTNVTVTSNVTAVSTAEALRTALTPNGQGGDLGTILLTSDITVSDWKAIGANYTSFVLDGNGHSISGLTDALISSIGPNCKVTVKNLTLKNVNISDTRTEGTVATVGALIRYISSEGGGTELAIDNCHVNGGSIYGWKYAGGFIGMIGGGSNNSVEIKNSTVENVEISTTDSSAGGFVAHTHSNLTLTNCSVLGSTSVSCAENRENGAAKAGWFVGTVNANTTTISSCTNRSTGKLGNNNAANPLNNGFVGRNAGGTITD